MIIKSEEKKLRGWEVEKMRSATADNLSSESSYETTYNLSHAKAQSSQRKAFKMLINLAPLRLCEKIISFFGDQTVCPLAGGLADN